MPKRYRRLTKKELYAPAKWQFYQSEAWLTLRYKVLKKFGKKCMCCGTTEGAMQVDHIKPRSKYPELALDFDNLQVLCRPCNMGKRAWDQTDFRDMEKFSEEKTQELLSKIINA